MGFVHQTSHCGSFVVAVMIWWCGDLQICGVFLGAAVREYPNQLCTVVPDACHCAGSSGLWACGRSRRWSRGRCGRVSGFSQGTSVGSQMQLGSNVFSIGPCWYVILHFFPSSCISDDTKALKTSRYSFYSLLVFRNFTSLPTNYMCVFSMYLWTSCDSFLVEHYWFGFLT
jgi:hypothetical protein